MGLADENLISDTCQQTQFPACPKLMAAFWDGKQIG